MYVHKQILTRRTPSLLRRETINVRNTASYTISSNFWIDQSPSTSGVVAPVVQAVTPRIRADASHALARSIWCCTDACRPCDGSCRFLFCSIWTVDRFSFVPAQIFYLVERHWRLPNPLVGRQLAKWQHLNRESRKDFLPSYWLPIICS